MSDRSSALQYLAENSCIRCDSAKFKRAWAEVKTARDSQALAEHFCIRWKRERVQTIAADVWDECKDEGPLRAMDELERALRQTLGGRIDPTHRALLRRLEEMAFAGELARGEFVKQGGELFRIAACIPDADGKSGWREPDIRGFRYHPSQPAGYRKKC